MKYKLLTDLYQNVESTSKRLEKTYYLSNFLKQVPDQELEQVILLLQGKVFAQWDDRKIGVAVKLVVRAIQLATGIEAKKIEQEWKNTGDLGKTAENLVKNKKQGTLFSAELSVKKVFNNIQKLATVEGVGSVDLKVKLVSELLSSAKPREARYVIRTVLEDLRVGIGDGIIRDSIVWVNFADELNINYDPEKKVINPDDREKYQERVDLVQRAYDMMTDFAKVAILAKEKGVAGLEKVELSVGRPLKVMLFQKARDMEDAFKTVGKLAAVEYKYDGFRVQIHKKGDKIKVFTRRLENATKQFPDVVKNVNDHVKGDEFVLDAEAVGYDPKTGKYLPFQSISQRIKRKYDIEDIAKKFPVEVNVFDILLYDGKDLISKPFLKRRKLIETIITPKEKQLVCSKQIITDSVEKAQEFYQAALDAGQEGVMLKNLKGIYKPGSRVGFGVKVKPVMESLDLVIVGAEWGEGKRSGWLTSLQLACYDPDTGGFLTIGKVGTGLKELEQEGGVTFGEVTALLRPHITQEDGREVVIKPELVIEINFEEIQKSPTYGSGYALRFPRVVRVRDDRRPEECSDIDFVEELYRTQRSRG